ncbi:hypothetical protein [Kitasatospora indigofera]|uniref:hypothetical protein n=1 Tax=Kitasatospora indigofera TaxID=67307 RepID=UPI003252BCA0
MTTSSTGRRRHRSAQAPAAPLPAGPAPAGPPTAGTAPARTSPSRAAAARSRTGAGRCCRTWSSERLLPGGAVARTTWHEPACAARG